MTLTKSDKNWISRCIERIVRRLLEQEAEITAQFGGYDGATDARDDDWADESRRKKIGFDTGMKKGKQK